MSFEKTWRWFGSDDKITLFQIQHIGIEGVVTALHHIPNGEIWQVEDIKSVQKDIKSYGMQWSVVESLPVHECIKYGGDNRDKLLENYKTSLKNLGESGIKTVCYNFMPVIDWIRTKLNHKLPDGSEVLYFSFVDFVMFDLCILKRKEAHRDYPEFVVQKARTRFNKLTTNECSKLIDTIIVKTQGFIDGITADNPEQAIEVFKELLSRYDGIGKHQLRENLKYFLNAVLPVAEKYNIKMCIHPDDPPMKVLGLPRIVSSQEDLKWIFDELPSPSNALTFCSGSLGASLNNSLTNIIKACSSRIYFVHLRSVEVLDNGDFFETGHLEGHVDMYSIIKQLLLEIKQRESFCKLPMRVDHGGKILFDQNVAYNPGYPLLGRMKAMAEISGMTKGIEQALLE